MSDEVEVKDVSGDGTGPWRLYLRGWGICMWPSPISQSNPKAYAEDAAHVLRKALDECTRTSRGEDPRDARLRELEAQRDAANARIEELEGLAERQYARLARQSAENRKRADAAESERDEWCKLAGELRASESAVEGALTDAGMVVGRWQADVVRELAARAMAAEAEVAQLRESLEWVREYRDHYYNAVQELMADVPEAVRWRIRYLEYRISGQRCRRHG